MNVYDKLGNTIQLAEMTDLMNPNLLINSDFRSGIINQKGQTSYSTRYQYGIDMWYQISAGTLTVNDNSISTSANLKFWFDEQPKNGDYTVAVSVDGIVYTYTFEGFTGTSKTHNFNIGSNTLGVEMITRQFILYMNGATFNFDFIKLEKGKHFTGMPSWNEAEELLKCQRYLFSCYKISGYGFEVGEGNVYIYVNIPTPMKKQGAISVGSTLQVIGDGAYKTLTISSVNVSSQDNNLVILSGVISEVGNLNIVKIFEFNNFTLDAYDY